MSATNHTMQAVSFKTLTALYICIPLCLILVLIDQVFWQGFVQSKLPHSPQTLLLFALFFGLPHIVASNIIMASHREYLRHFKSHIVGATAVAVSYLILAGTHIIPYAWAYFLFSAVTITHVLKQQFGLTRAVGRLSGKHYQLWVWSGILAGISIYTAVFMFKLLSPQQMQGLKIAALCLTSFYCLQGVLLHKQTKTAVARYYLWSNTLMIPAALIMYLLGYSFLTILCPRIIHDCTAFLIYINHDDNRRRKQQGLSLYRYADRLKIPTFVISIGLAIGLAYLIRWPSPDMLNTLFGAIIQPELILSALLLVKTYLELMHYYMESVTWKAGSPYRRFVRFTF